MWQKHFEFLTHVHAMTGEVVTASLHGWAQNHPDDIPWLTLDALPDRNPVHLSELEIGPSWTAACGTLDTTFLPGIEAKTPFTLLSPST